MNDELERIRKEAVAILLRLLEMPRKTTKNSVWVAGVPFENRTDHFLGHAVA
jgi:hypothetical protein